MNLRISGEIVGSTNVSGRDRVVGNGKRKDRDSHVICLEPKQSANSWPKHTSEFMDSGVGE
jgi:hypothetical protein